MILRAPRSKPRGASSVPVTSRELRAPEIGSLLTIACAPARSRRGPRRATSARAAEHARGPKHGARTSSTAARAVSPTRQLFASLLLLEAPTCFSAGGSAQVYQIFFERSPCSLAARRPLCRPCIKYCPATFFSTTIPSFPLLPTLTCSYLVTLLIKLPFSPFRAALGLFKARQHELLSTPAGASSRGARSALPRCGSSRPAAAAALYGAAAACAAVAARYRRAISDFKRCC